MKTPALAAIARHPLLAAAFIIAFGLCGTARACERCLREPTAFQSVGLYSDVIRLGGVSADIYYNRGSEFFNIAADGYEDYGLSSAKEARSRALADLNEAVRLSAGDREYDGGKRFFKMRGDIHMLASNFDLAAADYSEAIRLNPSDTALQNYLGAPVLNDGLYLARGAARYLTGDYVGAAEDFESARRTRIADEDFLAETAIELAQNKIAAGSGPHAEAEKHYFTGLVYYNNNYTGAIYVKRFEDALKCDSANAVYHRMLGLAHYRAFGSIDNVLFTNAYDRARADLLRAMRHIEEAVRLEPNDAKNYAARARIGAVINEYKSGSMIKFAPDWEKIHTERWCADSTMADYTRAVRLAPHVPEYRTARAAEYLRNWKDYNSALADYLEAVLLDSGIIYRVSAVATRYMMWHSGLAGYSDETFGEMLCAELTRLYGKAGAKLCKRKYSYPKVIRKKEKPAPDTEEYYYNKAKDHNSFWDIKERGSRVAHYTNLIKRYRKNAPYYAQRARAHYETREGRYGYDKAVADYVKAIELDPSFLYWGWLEEWRPPRGGGEESSYMNEFTEALCEELVRRFPDNAEYRYQRGRTRSAANAIADYREAVRLKPDIAAYHKALGDAYLSKYECQKAAASHLRAMRLDPKGIYFFLDSWGYPIKGYRAMLDKAIAGSGTVPAAECKKIADAMKKEWEERR
ncbi:MAG: hypothetical protein FWB85_06010 [Chitinispirillia bacterium]|nr:hypothetical protein [Chitinispirillia bacterium]MCL2241771.1 hypothetical protein [Chitinispirillia bacterium]